MINAKDSYNTFYSLNQKSGIPLVFIHGVGLNNTIWEPQVNAFENSVLTYDILGHGKTPFSKDEISFDIFSDQLLNLINEIKYTNREKKIKNIPLKVSFKGLIFF